MLKNIHCVYIINNFNCITGGLHFKRTDLNQAYVHLSVEEKSEEDSQNSVKTVPVTKII